MDFEVVDVAFSLRGDQPLPALYAYPLYAAVARYLPWIHEDRRIGIFSLNGSYQGRTIVLDPRSTLRIRTPAEALPRIITLTSRTLDIDGAMVQVGVPRVIPLRPAPRLYSRFVQIKLTANGNRVTPEEFLESANRQLRDLEIEAEAGIPIWESGPRAGDLKRRMVQIKGERHIGFALLVQGLTAEESLRLQVQGIGGRRKMGCGLFLPTRW